MILALLYSGSPFQECQWLLFSMFDSFSLLNTTRGEVNGKKFFTFFTLNYSGGGFMARLSLFVPRKSMALSGSQPISFLGSLDSLPQNLGCVWLQMEEIEVNLW